jgi:hypothetical protein
VVSAVHRRCCREAMSASLSSVARGAITTMPTWSRRPRRATFAFRRYLAALSCEADTLRPPRVAVVVRSSRRANTRDAPRLCHPGRHRLTLEAALDTRLGLMRLDRGGW